MVTNWLLHSIQVVLILTAQCLLFKPRNVTVRPDDLDAVVGRWNSNITCVLNQNMQGHYNASDLYFTYQIGKSDTTDVRLVYVNTINDSAIELRHFPEIDDPIQFFKQNKLAVKYVTCRIKGQQYGRNIEVKIRKPHDNPQIKDIVVENWETLSFDWETKEDCTLMYSMEYKAWYWNSSIDAHPLQCEHKDSVCKIPNPFEVASPGDMLIIKVNGSVRTDYSRGILETVTSEVVRVNLTDYLRPKKIDQINVTQNQSIKTLVFKPPKTNQRILYNINVNCTKPPFTQSKNTTRLVSDCDNATHPDRNSQKISVTEPLVGLPRYSNCTVSVRAISVEGGLWSKWTHHDFQTLQDVPLAAPRSCKGCFQVKETGIGSLFHAIVYFTPLSEEEARGRVELYRIKIIEHGFVKNETELIPDPLFLSSFLLSNLWNESDYKISIEAKTKSGYNETLNLSSSTILVPQSKHRPKSLSHKFTVVVLNETAVRTTFEMDERSGTDKLFLFWCKGRVESNTPCQDVLKWKEFPIASTVNAINITDVVFLDKDESINMFIFGTGIERNGKSSGITWNSCTYDIRSRPPKPRIETYHSTSSGISISLLEPSCQSIGEERGFVIGYRLFLCPIESSDSTKGHRCLAKMRILEFDGQHTVLNLNDLNPSQTYSIMISSLSETKTSQNVTITATTLATNVSFIWVVIVFVVVFSIVFVVVVIALVPFKEKTIWQYLKDIRSVGPIVIPPSSKFANFDSGQRLAEDEGYKSNGSGESAAENKSISISVPIDVDVLDTCNGPATFNDPVTSAVSASFNGSGTVGLPVAFNGPANVDGPVLFNVSANVDVSVAFNGPANVDGPVDFIGPSTTDILVVSVVPNAIDVPVNANAAAFLIPSISAEISSYASVGDSDHRILPNVFTGSTKASKDPSISATFKSKVDEEVSQHQSQQPHEPASKALTHDLSSFCKGLFSDQCYTGKATGQSTYDAMHFEKPSSNLDEDYVGGSQRVCDVFLPVPSEPAKPVMFDSGSEFHINGSEDGLSSLQTEIYDSSDARNEDVSSGTGYHHASKVSPSRSADSVCDDTQNDSDYPPMRIIEVDFYDDNGMLEKKPLADDVTISTDSIMISDDVTFSTDIKSTGDIAVSTGDIISADVIALPDVMTISDDLVLKKAVDGSPKGVLSVCGGYDRDQSVDEDCIYSTVVDVNVSCRADRERQRLSSHLPLVDQIPPVSGEVDDGYYSGSRVLGSLSSSPRTPGSDGSEGGYWSLRDDVQDQRHDDWSVNPVSLNHSAPILPWSLNLQQTDSEPFLERVLPSILPPCV